VSSQPSDPLQWFILRKDSVLVSEEEPPKVPVLNANAKPPVGVDCRHLLNGTREPGIVAAGAEERAKAPAGYRWIRLRSLFTGGVEELFWPAGEAFQVVNWDRTTRFCGACGTRTRQKDNERVAVCPECGFEQYPRISPAMICAVVRDGKLLLAQNVRYRGGHYSVLAGFAESGENLEQCVAREVKEEVGVSVQNIRYFGSQPWPFPHSLMIGFTAEWSSGEIHIDETELSEAGWFAPSELPDQLPGHPTIARCLIDWFATTYRG